MTCAARSSRRRPRCRASPRGWGSILIRSAWKARRPGRGCRPPRHLRHRPCPGWRRPSTSRGGIQSRSSRVTSLTRSPACWAASPGTSASSSLTPIWRCSSRRIGGLGCTVVAQAGRGRSVAWLSLDSLVPLGPSGRDSVQGLPLPPGLIRDYQHGGVSPCWAPASSIGPVTAGISWPALTHPAGGSNGSAANPRLPEVIGFSLTPHAPGGGGEGMPHHPAPVRSSAPTWPTACGVADTALMVTVIGMMCPVGSARICAGGHRHALASPRRRVARYHDEGVQQQERCCIEEQARDNRRDHRSRRRCRDSARCPRPRAGRGQ